MRRLNGSITKRANGRFMAQVAVGRKADGKVRRETRVFDTRAQAEEWVRVRSVEMGRRPDLGAGVTLSQLWALYEREMEGTLAPKTLQSYRSLMRVHWLPTMSDADISRIEPSHVQQLVDRMTHENALHAKRCLSSVLTFAVGRGLLAANPLRGHKFRIPAKIQGGDVDDDDPFAAIEGARDVWTAQNVLRCYDLIRGLPLEPAWLMCVGAGLRVEEALAIRPVDVRRVEVADHMVTQLAVHAAVTPVGGRKATKTRQSIRVVPVLEPFGARLWELVQATDDPRSPVCAVSAHRQNKHWRNYFEPPSLSKHAPRATTYRGRLQELPYVPLSKMRNTHVTLLQEAGVSDSINALAHGHTESVERRHYMQPDVTRALAGHLRVVE